MYNAFWRLALFVRGQSFSVKTFDRSRNGCQVIREGAGNDFRGPSVQALPLPSRVSFSRARFSCAHYFQAPATQATVITFATVVTIVSFVTVLTVVNIVTVVTILTVVTVVTLSP